MNTPLYSALMKYSKEKYPFHMPGHKLGQFGDMKALDFTALDVTEASELDNLYEAEGIIKEAMVLMADFYGAKETLFLTNGSTAGILASILALCKPGEKILIARNSHHSVWHALILSGAQPIYIMPRYDEETGLMMEMTVEAVEKALKKHPDVKGALMVSPTYEGVVSPIAEIAKVLHKRDKVLIVDEAHGAHFAVHSSFPLSSVEEGADVVIQSMHKTLPTFTQSALLHRNSERITGEQIIQALRMVQTSSPSYVFMATMDYMRAYMEEHADEIESSYINPLFKLRKNLKGLKRLKLLEPTHVAYDKGKVVILTHNSSIDGYTLGQYLEEHYGLVCEAMLPQLVILMTTLADGEEQLNRLECALIEIDQDCTYSFGQNADIHHKENFLTLEKLEDVEEPILTPREVYYSETEWMEVHEAVGAVVAQSIMLYPPGIPIISVGERLTTQHLKWIETYGLKLKGIQVRDEENLCKVVKVKLE